MVIIENRYDMTNQPGRGGTPYQLHGGFEEFNDNEISRFSVVKSKI